MEDKFIGTKIGSLTVVGWDGERSGGSKVYQVKCSTCALDPELFGSAIFRSTKYNLVNNGQIPCGCSKQPRWTAAQYRLLIDRKSNSKYSAVIPDDAKNNTTKVSCKCNAKNCGYEWEASINKLLNNGTACKKCTGFLPITENEAIERVQAICLEKNFRFIRFKNGWRNIRSKLLLICHCGHTWDPMYNTIINGGNGCSSCAKTGYDPSKPGTFYVHLWTHPDTKHQFLKYGITNHPDKRIKQQKRNTKYIPKQLLSLDFQDGSIPPAIEKVIDTHKKQFQISNQVTKDLFQDGFSETLPTNTEEYNFVDNLVFQIAMCRMKPL